MRSSLLRLGLPFGLVVAGAAASAVIAWREAHRAQATARLLMRDYASFAADKFVQLSALRYRATIGFANPVPGEQSPLRVLEEYARRHDTAPALELPLPGQTVVDYFFAFDAEARSLAFSGRTPDVQERQRLLVAASTFDPQCGPSQRVAIGRIPPLLCSGLVETDSRGLVRRIYGVCLDPARSVERFFAPLVEAQDGAACPPGLLPASLSSIRSAAAAASFVLHDAGERVLLASRPAYTDSPAVRQALSPELPFSAWTIEVAVNPAAVAPLLPYGGRGAPWPALSLVALLVVASGALALAAVRRENHLSSLQQDFVANVSHELKTPLARVRLFNELLLGAAAEDTPKSASYRRIIDRECRRLTLLIDNILDFSRRGRSSRTHAASNLDLAATFAEALETFRAASDQGTLNINYTLDAVGSFRGDGQALQQVLVNLLDNAAKYSPEGSPIEVALTSDGAWARLRVRDQGMGIPEREHARIFEPFYRSAANGGSATGSGLGLALVSRTVSAHGGHITVESEPGKGSTFVVSLPLAS
jgi:signal transduction histidine kinase